MQDSLDAVVQSLQWVLAFGLGVSSLYLPVKELRKRWELIYRSRSLAMLSDSTVDEFNKFYCSVERRFGSYGGFLTQLEAGSEDAVAHQKKLREALYGLERGLTLLRNSPV